jgi:hypothetical protein
MKRIVTFSQQEPDAQARVCLLGSVASSKIFFLVGESQSGRDQCGQATKGVWGMSWRQEAMKGVENCDKPGGLVKRELIPGFPNDHVLNP